MRQQNRREDRITIESVVLPFLGSRGGDYQPFQYLLRDVSPGGVQVALPQWMVSRERLVPGETVHFHLPFKLGDKVLDSGLVAWERWDAEEGAQFVGVSLDTLAPVHYPVYLQVDTRKEDTRQVVLDLSLFKDSGTLAGKVLKDSLLLKRGILIYLRHLSAYFSRVGGLMEEDWAFFKETVLDDVRSRVEANAARLSNWCDACQREGMSSDIVSLLDMGELRQAMEPELYLDLFSHTLGESTAQLYLEAIKELEKRIFANHNTLVMLYISTL